MMPVNRFATLLLSVLMPAAALANNFNWQRPYVGVYLGGAFGNTQLSTNAGTVTTTSYFTTVPDINAVATAGTGTHNPSRLIGGIDAGHDWAWKQMIYGIALDYSTLSLSSSNTNIGTYPDSTDQYSVHTTMQTNWLFTLRGRVGYQTIVMCYPSLFYVTGGMAMTQLKVSNRFNDNSDLIGSGSSSTSQNQIGWTAGAGVEVAIYNNISINAEYLYVRIPSVKTTASIFNTEGGFGIPTRSMMSPLSTNANLYANIIKIGFNYRFDE